MLEKRSARGVVAAVLGLASIAGACLSLRARGDLAVAALESARCAPIRVVDRYGKLLREVPGACAPYGRSRWTTLADIPPIVTQLVIASEDSRFRLHPGVDPMAVLRAAASNMRARKVVSGASTLTMQLARLLEAVTESERSPSRSNAKSSRATATTHESRASEKAAPRDKPHSWVAKVSRAWTALALEGRLRKDEILEAYLNLAYYGAGAYGIDSAARAYFGKPLTALSDTESSLLATLPRAPALYDLRRDPTRAAQRRDHILASLVQRGELDATRQRAIASAPVHIAARSKPPEPRAGHFVDFALAQLPTSVRRAGAEVRSTLDLDLQTTLERAVAEHVASLADCDVDQAGLVVLDADTGAIRAMVGSRGYDTSQVNITVRRRQLGSLLKPFVYALAIERGESAASIALDVGDVSPDYQARDWVGREAGPLSFKEALAGSYNLAAIHTLERVGVASLHARLRSAGVAELTASPARYGLRLALGSARVRLLDVASGYGFLVRGGIVRPAHAIEELEQNDQVWAPTVAPDRAIFSPAVSWQVMDMLSDAAARHRRFGLGLPLETGVPHEAASPLAAKTGTASGLSDASAILATREFIVAAWAGRFDGKPTRGTSGMWAAAPLASRALVAALGGKSGSLPVRPADASPHTIAALGGKAASLPVRPADALPNRSSAALSGEKINPSLPPELEPWAERARARAGRTRESAAR